MPYKYFYILILLYNLNFSVGAQQRNPFDIDTNTYPLELTEQASTDTFEQEITNQIDQQASSNPFDVDHVPLSKQNINTEKRKIPVSKKPKSRPSIDLSKKIDNKPIGNFMFWLFGGSLLLLSIVINLKRKTFANLYRSIFNDNYLNLMQREEGGGKSVFFLLLYILFFVNASVFIYLSLKYLQSGATISTYIFALGFVSVVYIFRHFSMLIVAKTFPFKKSISQFNFTIMIFNVILGIVLFPINVFFAYSPLVSIMFYLGLAAILFFYSIRQLRGLFLAFRIPGLNLFHFFIYLCTCEIVPILIIIKLISNYNSSI